MTPKEILEKAYGNMPKEVGINFDITWLPTWRGMRYYWYKLVRSITR
jgi:hypothetical protein